MQSESGEDTRDDAKWICFKKKFEIFLIYLTGAIICNHFNNYTSESMQ